jgi:hypothetical protein
MPTNRTTRGTRRRHVNEAAIRAWLRADYFALHRALNLHPGVPSPLPTSITPLGCDPDCPPDRDYTGWARGWPESVALQRELLAIAGPPGEIEGDESRRLPSCRRRPQERGRRCFGDDNSG